jgi:hypothetical protein
MTPTHSSWLAGPGVVLAVLLPKCPLCVAALLSWLGFGAAFASALAPWLHHVLLAVAVCAIASGVASAIVRLRRSTHVCACERRQHSRG